MKKLLLTSFLTFSACTFWGQSVPNGGFENWTLNTFETPQFYFSSNSDHGGFPPYKVLKTSDAKSGVYAAQLNTILVGIDTINSYMANGDPSHPAGQGIPYTEQATGITGYYKGNFANNDSAIVWVIFKKNGAIIGNYLNHIGTDQANYTAFNFTFSPALATTPDSMIIAFTSSNLVVNKGVPGTTVQFDSIAFTGVASQPVNFNGDFELWTMQSVSTLNQWELNGSAGQTNDKYTGNFALELVTDDHGNGGPQAATATNGHGYQGGTNGGTPFSNQVDTLVFYYKFSAADATDSARVTLEFKNNGTPIQFFGILLKDTGSYRRVQMPINLGSVPDTVLFFINSTKLGSNVPSSYVGGTLKLDNMFFKSQQVPITAFLAPASGCLNQAVQLNDNSDNLPNAWSWDLTGGATDTSNLQNPTVTYTATGTYTIGLIASNAFGSGSLVTQTISINNVPVVTVNSPTMCAGDSAILVAGGASTYLWGNLSTNDSITVFPVSTANYTVTGAQNGCSAAATSTVTVINCSTAIRTNQSEVSIYPNPSAAQFHVVLNEAGVSLQVFDLTGKKVLSRAISGMETVIDLNEMPGGIYFVRSEDPRKYGSKENNQT